jgi:O-antigen/teichoic acid export membrane protein
LGVEEFGRFALVWMVVLIATSVHDSLLVVPMLTLGSKKDPAEKDVFFSVILVGQAVFVFLACIVIWFGSLGVDAILPDLDLGNLNIALAATAVSFFSREFFRRYFFVRNRPSVSLWNDALGYAAQFALLLAVARYATLSIEAALWIIAGGGLVTCLVALPRIQLTRFPLATMHRITLEIWRFSKWILAASGMSTIANYVYMLVVGTLLGTAAVGGIRAAQNLMRATHVLLLALENVVPVRAGSHYRISGLRGFVAFLRRTAWTLGLASAAIALIAGVAPEFWLTLIYGEDYGEFGIILQIIAFQSLVGALAFVLRSGLRTLEMTRSVFLSQVANTICFLLLAYPIMTAFGVVGAALGRLVGNLLYLTLLWKYLGRLIHAQRSED